MDEDRAELIRQLCTQIGMIMEDASVDALLSQPDEDLATKVADLAIAIDQARALAGAATALCQIA